MCFVNCFLMKKLPRFNNYYLWEGETGWVTPPLRRWTVPLHHPTEMINNTTALASEWVIGDSSGQLFYPDSKNAIPSGSFPDPWGSSYCSLWDRWETWDSVVVRWCMIPPAQGSNTKDPWHSSPENSDSCFALNVCGSGSDSELTQLGLLFIVWHVLWLQTQDILPRYLIPWLCTLLPHPPTCLLWRYIYLCLSSGQSCLIPWPSVPRSHTHTLRARCHWEHRHVKLEDAILKIGWSGDRPVFPMKTVRALVATMSPGE